LEQQTKDLKQSNDVKHSNDDYEFSNSNRDWLPFSLRTDAFYLEQNELSLNSRMYERKETDPEYFFSLTIGDLVIQRCGRYEFSWYRFKDSAITDSDDL
jgi:hypothetical protein